VALVFASIILWIVTAPALARDASDAQEVTLQVRTDPPGALVMACDSDPCNEATATILGKAPLMRRLPMPATGWTLEAAKAGYDEARAHVAPDAPGASLRLEPLTAEERKQRGFREAGPAETLFIVPNVVATHKVGAAGFDDATASRAFSDRFLRSLERTLNRRFPSRVQRRDVGEFASTADWAELQASLSGNRVEKIGFYPVPVYLKLSAQRQAQVSGIGGAVLFVRAEAYYLGSGARFARAAVPILLMAGSAAAGAAAAGAAGSPVFVYGVYGPAPNQDFLHAQYFLVHAQTGEVMWVGQVDAPAHFENDAAVESVARAIGDGIPQGALAGADLH